MFLKPSLRQSFPQTYGGNQSPRPTFPQKMNKGQRQPLSPLAIYSKCAEDVLNTSTRPKTRTVGQEEATTPQTIARHMSTQELLDIAFDMPATPPMKINTPSFTKESLVDKNNVMLATPTIQTILALVDQMKLKINETLGLCF